jgi:hypothetical protein
MVINNNIMLSILIPTVVGREIELGKLIHKIQMSYGDVKWEITITKFADGSEWGWCHADCPIEIYFYKDNKEMTIGEKREKLYNGCNGKFAWEIDDDDDIADNAIELILEAIKSNPDVDVISFEEYCNMDGKEYKSNHSATYSGWEGEGHTEFADGFHFHRTPFFKDVIRTELAKSVPISHCRFGEDHIFANDLHPKIQSEIHISEPLYRYIHISSPHNERYGIV